MCAHPGLEGAVVSQNKDSTVKVVLLGGEGWRVDGDVWVSVREELVGGCRAGGPCPEVPEVLLQVRISIVKRIWVDNVEVLLLCSRLRRRDNPQCRPPDYAFLLC